MKNKTFSISAIALAVAFWFFDASVHYFIYGEPEFEYIPSDNNELWMRIVIVVLLVSFGIFSDYVANKIMYKNKQLEVVRAYSALIDASQISLNNLVVQMQLFKREALRSKGFDRNVIELYENAINGATELANTFANIKDVSEQGTTTVGKRETGNNNRL